MSNQPTPTNGFTPTNGDTLMNDLIPMNADTRAGSEARMPSDTAPARRWWALALLSGTAFMVVLDTSSVVTALPSIQADLAMAPSALQWVVTIYALTFGGLMLLGGRVADLVGRRRLFMVSIVAFVAASILCGMATSGTMLIAARGLQGVSAAFLLPSALALLMTIFPDGPDRHRALAVWSAIAGIGGIAGFLVGGPLTDGPGWPWIYFMNVPMGLVMLALAPVLLTDSRSERTTRLDVPGAVTATSSLILFVYAISTVPETGWSHPRTVAMTVTAVALAAAFVVIERRSAAPLVPPHLFRSPTLVGGNLVLVAVGMSMGFFVTLSLYAQQILGYTAWEFGLAMLAASIPAIAGSTAASPAVTRFGPRPVVATSTLLMAVGLGLLARAPVDGTFTTDLLVPLVVVGAGFGAAGVAASIAALTDVPADDVGVASGVEESAYQIGTPLGIAILTTIATARTTGLLDSGADLAHAQVAGFQHAFAAAAILAAVATIIALALLRPSARHDTDRADNDRSPTRRDLEPSPLPAAGSTLPGYDASLTR